MEKKSLPDPRFS